jgi:hypothetical protein
MLPTACWLVPPMGTVITAIPALRRSCVRGNRRALVSSAAIPEPHFACNVLWGKIDALELLGDSFWSEE